MAETPEPMPVLAEFDRALPVTLDDVAAELRKLRQATYRLTAAVTAQSGQDRTTRQQLDHLDVMLHEVTQFIAENKPALERATSLLDPGQPMRAWMRKPRKDHANGR